MSGPRHFDGQTEWDVWDPKRGTEGWTQPGWALPSDANRYIGKDDPYWNTVLDNARRTYGDPNIHYNTDDIGQPRRLVFGDQTPLPKDATVVYHDASTKRDWVQNDDGTVSLMGAGGTLNAPIAPSGYRTAGSGYAPIDAHGQQIAPQLSGVPNSDNGFHTDPATGVLTPENADGGYYTLGPDGAKTFFDKDGHPITADALATDLQQSGKAADAVAKLHDELKKQYSAMSDAEEGLSDVLLNAHAATAAGRQRLSEIQTKIIDAVDNPAMSTDTPAGERSFLTFLHSQVGAVNDLVTSGSLTADDQAKTASALSKLYGADDSGGQPPAPPQPSQPEPAPDAGTPADAGLVPDEPMPDPSLSPLTSELPGALGGLGGLGGTPLDGLGGLAGAIAQLAESASQAGDHGPDHDRSPGTVEKADDTTAKNKDAAGGADKPDPVGKQSDGVDRQPATDGPPAPVAPPPTALVAPPPTALVAPPPTDTVRLPDGSSANARTPAAAQAVAAYLGGDTVDAAYRKNNLALPPPGTPVTNPVDPSQLACGDVGVFRDHYVVALSSVKALANGQVVALGSVASSPDFLGWIDPTATAGRPHPAPPPAAQALADAATAVPAG
jgi:hypothetical protein